MIFIARYLSYRWSPWSGRRCRDWCFGCCRIGRWRCNFGRYEVLSCTQANGDVAPLSLFCALLYPFFFLPLLHYLSLLLCAVTQVLRGIAAVPEAVTAPKQGKWWNESIHAWVYTDLSKMQVPENDDDLLGNIQAELDASGKPTGASTGAVKDPYYYDMLEVRVDGDNDYTTMCDLQIP